MSPKSKIYTSEELHKLILANGRILAMFQSEPLEIVTGHREVNDLLEEKPASAEFVAYLVGLQGHALNQIARGEPSRRSREGALVNLLYKTERMVCEKLDPK